MTDYNQNFEMVRGDTKTVTIAIRDKSGNPQPVTGATSIKWQAWFRGSVQISKDIAAIAIIDLNGTDDGLQFVLDPTDTQSLTAGMYEHEAEVVDAGGNRVTTTKGLMKLIKDTIPNS